MSTNKRLVLVRHAHRDTSRGRERDNGLSDKGKAQAKRITEYLYNNYSESELVLISSPSKRCTQTLKPFAKLIDEPIENLSVLYEQNPEESFKQFERRVQYFCSSWEKSETPVTILCSHGDWIPTCVFHFLNIGIGLKKGGIVELEQTDEGVNIRTLLQSLKAFSNS